MNIIEFKEKVYQRILTQYLKDVRKTKLTVKDYLSLPLYLLPFILISTALSYGLSGMDEKAKVFFIAILYLLSTIFWIENIIKSFQSILNYKKQSNIFWETSNHDLSENEISKNLDKYSSSQVYKSQSNIFRKLFKFAL